MMSSQPQSDVHDDFDHADRTAYRWSAAAWFEDLQTVILSHVEKLEAEYTQKHAPTEKPKTATHTSWVRTQDGREEDDHGDGFGGGNFGIVRGGHLFEKAGVAFSKVRGHFPPEFAKTIPGCGEEGSFSATGISLVFHPRHPHVPIVHMNMRFIQTEEKSWFGGGADLTPVCVNDVDTQHFHNALQGACDDFHPGAYNHFKDWCDRYFYLPHRSETRGVGGIFYDYCFVDPAAQDGDYALDRISFDHGMAFSKRVGAEFLKAYDDIVRKNWNKPYDEADIKAQKIKRARYAEFNLIYDRGIKFGLNTGGNIDAMFMSLPPQCGWE